MLITVWILHLTLFLPQDAGQQRLSLQDLMNRFEEDSEITLGQSGITIRSQSFSCRKKRVEAIIFQPPGIGPFPGVLLIPGYARSARDYIPLGVNMARRGFAAMAVTQPGFGRSEGPPDWVGPHTMEALTMGFERFKTAPFVDPGRLAVFGYSRGAVAAALLAVRLEGLRAAVFAAGIYDLKAEYETNRDEGIRKNMEKETNLTDGAFKLRSPLFMMEDLTCPVLILHGEQDVNASVAQAKRLRDRLEELKKPYEIKLYPERAHDIGRDHLYGALFDFLGRRLSEVQDSGPGDKIQKTRVAEKQGG